MAGTTAPNPVSTAKDVAHYVVWKSKEIERPVTNLKLQKILYYAWIEYYRKTQTYLFKDGFYAWRLGPVVPDVYYDYRFCVAMPIKYPADNASDPDFPVRKFLDGVIEEYKDKTGSELVAMTHGDLSNGVITAWNNVYKEGQRDTPIRFEDIISIECEG